METFLAERKPRHSNLENRRLSFEALVMRTLCPWAGPSKGHQLTWSDEEVLSVYSRIVGGHCTAHRSALVMKNAGIGNECLQIVGIGFLLAS
eukprot:1149578-Pelagomonas_calceolata.AAC.3